MLHFEEMTPFRYQVVTNSPDKLYAAVFDTSSKTLVTGWIFYAEAVHMARKLCGFA